MLPLSHVYVSTQVTGRETPLLILGSVLPDVSWNPGSMITRDKIHDAPNEFYEYISTNKKHLLDLAIGVRLHTHIDKGADFYSDGLNYDGFAYIEGAKLEPDIVKMLGQSSIMSKVLSHNFIEAGIDLLLLENKPHLLEIYKKSVDNVNVEEIAEDLSNHLDLDPSIISSEINEFLEFFGPKAYTTEENFVTGSAHLVNKRTAHETKHEEVATILNSSKEIMKNKYENLLNNAIEKMRVDFSEFTA